MITAAATTAAAAAAAAADSFTGTIIKSSVKHRDGRSIIFGEFEIEVYPVVFGLAFHQFPDSCVYMR